MLMSLALHQDVKRMPILVNRSPQVVTFVFDSQHHFVKIHLVAAGAAMRIASAPAPPLLVLAGRMHGHLIGTGKRN
jgi:hypothetical protein